MTIVFSALVGYLLGSVPTANTLAGLWGIDLRSNGSGNPGTANARSLGGYPLAATVLVVEMGKGVAAAIAGMALAGDVGAVVAGLAAAAGNVYNVWYRFQGGKGLAIGAGVLIGIWPTVVPFLLVLIAIAAFVFRSAGMAAVLTLVSLVVAAFIWWTAGLQTGWGITDHNLLLLIGIGLAMILWRKHWVDASSPSRE